ncbi:MAG: tetratricopeptide repeat protein, partial [Deltaproteobacteria bacterium]|nr:tetratricopeptide repeat protein [Deltaproteobacteria bacterium]
MSLLNRFLPIPLIVLLAMGIYVNTLKNGFVFDDKDTIVNNIFIKELNNLPKLFDKDYFKLSGEISYRPVVTFTYIFEYALFGLKPWGYHLTNILLHAFNVVLLYIFVQLLIEGSDRAKVVPLLTAFLFATHPVLTEAVNAISFREDLLVFLFYITTLNLYLISRPNSKAGRPPFWTVMLYLASCVTFFIALFSKEMAVTLPLIIYWYEWVYCDKKRDLVKILFNWYNIGYIVITLFYIYLRSYYFHNPMERDFLGWEVADRLLTVPWLILNFLKLTIFPISLSVDYLIMPVKDAASLSFLLPSISIISLIGMTFLIGKKEKWIAFGIGFFLITLTPVYNIIPITNPLAIRYLYMPAVGFCMAMGLNFCLLYEAFISRHKTRKLYLSILFIAIMVIYSSGAINRNKAWKDNYSLWSDAARKVPQNIRPYYNDLGNILYEQGRFEEAIKQYQMAIRLRPDFVEAYNNLGNVLVEMGRVE